MLHKNDISKALSEFLRTYHSSPFGDYALEAKNPDYRHCDQIRILYIMVFETY